MLEKLMNSPIAWLILALISVISFIFGIYTWITGKRKKEISVSDISHILIKAGKSQIPKLDVIYDGLSIDNLTVTKFYIWNSGNDVIDSSDIVKTKEFAIHSSEDTRILDAQILNVVDQSNKICITSIDPDQVVIGFEYLDQGEGCLIQLLHTGIADELHCDCKIKGGNKVRYCHEDGPKTVPVTSGIASFINIVLEAVPMLLIGIGGVGATKIADAMELDYERWSGTLGLWLIWLAVGGGAFLIFKLLQRKYNKTFHRDVPKVLKRR